MCPLPPSGAVADPSADYDEIGGDVDPIHDTAFFLETLRQQSTLGRRPTTRRDEPTRLTATQNDEPRRPIAMVCAGQTTDHHDDIRARTDRPAMIQCERRSSYPAISHRGGSENPHGDGSPRFRYRAPWRRSDTGSPRAQTGRAAPPGGKGKRRDLSGREKPCQVGAPRPRTRKRPIGRVTVHGTPCAHSHPGVAVRDWQRNPAHTE